MNEKINEITQRVYKAAFESLGDKLDNVLRDGVVINAG